MASAESSLMVSATAIIPITCFSFANRIGVFPCFAHCSGLSFCPTDTSPATPKMYFTLPPKYITPSIFAFSPFPETAAKSIVSRSAIPFSSAYDTMAFATGCSLLLSSEYAMASNSSSRIPSIGSTSVTDIFPVVIVPVLSSATICVRPASSCTAAVLYRIPAFAPTPFPTMIATGVAKPKAHGQLITSTDTALAIA